MVQAGGIAHASMDGNNSGRVNAEVFNEFKNSDLANSDFSVIVNC